MSARLSAENDAVRAARGHRFDGDYCLFCGCGFSFAPTDDDDDFKECPRTRSCRFRVWTGPTRVADVAKAIRTIPGVTGVVEGTEHVLFDCAEVTPDGILRRAHAVGESSASWPFLDHGGCRRIL